MKEGDSITEEMSDGSIVTMFIYNGVVLKATKKVFRYIAPAFDPLVPRTYLPEEPLMYFTETPYGVVFVDEMVLKFKDMFLGTDIEFPTKPTWVEE